MTSVRTRGDTTQFPTLHSTHVKARCAAVIAAWLVIAPAPSLAAEAKPDAPTSIDSLFGDAVAKEPARDDVKLNGYVSSELAYTFASPAHWSRMLVRGQVDATGSFSENVKWKLSGRIDYDAVYNLTDFYPPPVAHDARFELFARENYIDVNADNWNFRLGRQHIVWGEVIALFAADVVSAKDLREFILPDFSVVRIPQWAARAEYFKDDFHAEFVWIPVATYNEIGVPGAEFYAAPPAPPGFATVVENEQIPSRSLGHTNYGVRVGWLRGGWDGALYYYGSMDQAPTFYRKVTLDPQPTFVFQPRHERINQGGFTLAKDFGFALLKSEAVYTSGRKYNVNDARPDGLVAQNTIDWVASAEFGVPMLPDTRLTIQGVQRIYVNHASDLDASKYENGYALYASTQLPQGWEATVLWGASFNRRDSMFRASMARNFQRNWRLAVGVDVFDGSSQGIFGQYGNKDRVYAQVTYSF
jgi:hypothetical protein